MQAEYQWVNKKSKYRDSLMFLILKYFFWMIFRLNSWHLLNSPRVGWTYEWHDMTKYSKSPQAKHWCKTSKAPTYLFPVIAWPMWWSTCISMYWIIILIHGIRPPGNWLSSAYWYWFGGVGYSKDENTSCTRCALSAHECVIK